MGEKSKRNKIAWSDDLSYDSEEEREKERIALAELAEIEAPEKPSYTEDELNQLVKYIKQITTLPYLTDDHWNEDCTIAIKQFLMEPKNVILYIYFDKDLLKSSLVTPVVTEYSMTYFLRQLDMIFSVENFHDEIIFGTIVESPECCLLKTVQIVYAPVLLSMTSWPNHVKNRINMEIHNFLLNLTDRYHKIAGLTVIYIPQECLNKTMDEAVGDVQLVKRLENIVMYWTKQIKSSIEDHDLLDLQEELLCPVDELEFWIYRYKNLNSLMHQINNPNVVYISDILKNSRSSYIKYFEMLIAELQCKMDETVSNIKYLQILKKPCKDMESCKNLEELPTHISHILHLFRFIQIESPYYNTNEKITKLCGYFSNQIIIQCSLSVDLKSLFEGKTRTSMDQLLKCIQCCNVYKEIYNSISDAHDSVKPNSWDLDKGIIFNYVDSFVQRCFDMLEVCNGIIVFGRMNEIEKVNIPRFGGTKGREFEDRFENFETMFNDAVKKIESIENDILNVRAAFWSDYILEFRNTTRKIETLIQHLIMTLFKDVNNVEEAIQILSSTQNYLKRGNLEEFSSKITSEIWNIFMRIIESTKHDMIEYRSSTLSGVPNYSGQALQLNMCKNFLLYNKNIMDTAIWMPQCSNSINILNEYKILMAAIDKSLKNIWTLWIISLGTENVLMDGLNRTLLSNSNIKSTLLECNFDRNIMRAYKESFHWENIQFEIPTNIIKIQSKMNEAILLYEDCLTITTQYNRILTSLSQEETLLYKPVINMCKKQLEDAIFNFRWVSSDLQPYLIDCLKSIENTRNLLGKYKSSNINIIKFLEDICNSPLILYKEFTILDIEEFQKDISTMMKNGIDDFLKIYKNIIENIFRIYQGLEEHITDIIPNWNKYVMQIDNLLEMAIKFNMRGTMRNIYKNISGDGTVGPSPFLKIGLILRDGEINMIPTQNQIFNVITKIFDGIIDDFKNIPRLSDQFKLVKCGFVRFGDVIMNDVECRKYQNLIITDVNKTLKMVDKHKEKWNIYNHIWKIPKKDFLEDYCRQKPSSNEFDKDITRYVELASDIQMKENVIQISFIHLNVTDLKAALIRECKQWQELFMEVMKNLIQGDINVVLRFAKHSGEGVKYQAVSLKEFQDLMHHYDKLCIEIAEKKTIKTSSEKLDSP